MTTARTIIQDCLTFGLNKLSIGETADADTLDVCLRGLNSIADEWNGSKSFLFRTLITASASGITGTTATLGTDWTAISPGDEILGATYADSGVDVPMHKLTMQQYHEIGLKSETGLPSYFAHDGLSTVYLYPAATGQTISLRTRQAVSEFTDLDTDYDMPDGYKSALADCLAERLAPTINPSMLGLAQQKAAAARNRVAGQTIEPAILNTARGRRASILLG